MDDTTAASAGFVLAGVALAASLFEWTRGEQVVALVGVALAAVALAGFALRRYGRLDRRAGAALAAAGSIGVVAVATYAALRGIGRPEAVVTAVAGGGGTVFAYADWRGVERAALGEKAIATAIGVAVGALGIVGIYAWAILAFLLATIVAPAGLGRSAETVLSTLASGAGTVTVAALYLRWTGRDVSFIDVRRPGLRDVAYVVGGTLAVLGGNLGIGLAFQQFGVESASHTIVQTAEAEPGVLLALIPLSYLVIAPGEELLYRNVVQKSLRTAYSPVAGVAVASAIFAAVHLPAYSPPGASFVATLSTLGVVFVLALVLGGLYERTGNLVVSILAHGTFNAIAFAATYWQLTGAIGG